MQHDCVGAILVRDQRILLGRRADDAAWLAGAWDVFGGHIEACERAEQALVRELREELGIEAIEFAPIGTLADTHPVPWRLRVFAIHRWRGEPRNLQVHEHAELRWCTLADAQQRLAAAHDGFAALLAHALEPASDAARMRTGD